MYSLAVGVLICKYHLKIASHVRLCFIPDSQKQYWWSQYKLSYCVMQCRVPKRLSCWVSLVIAGKICERAKQRKQNLVKWNKRQLFWQSSVLCEFYTTLYFLHSHFENRQETAHQLGISFCICVNFCICICACISIFIYVSVLIASPTPPFFTPVRVLYVCVLFVFLFLPFCICTSFTLILLPMVETMHSVKDLRQLGILIFCLCF